MRILIASPIDAEAVEQLRARHAVVCAAGAGRDGFWAGLADCEALVFRSGIAISEAVLDQAPRLRLLVRAGCGLDNVALEEVTRRGIQLARIPEPAAQAVAEMALALMFALARNLREADRQWRAGRWLKDELEGTLLAGKTLGIVGAGNIGSRVGALGAAVGMRPIGCVREPTAEIAATLRAKGIELAAFEEVVSRADFLSLHVPLAEDTRNLIDAGVLARMKAGAFLINLARGGVVDEAALCRALVEGRLRGAALDVHEQEGEGRISPLAGLPNVLLTPHIGAMTLDTQRQIGRRVVQIIEHFAAAIRGAPGHPAHPEEDLPRGSYSAVSEEPLSL